MASRRARPTTQFPDHNNEASARRRQGSRGMPPAVRRSAFGAGSAIAGSAYGMRRNVVEPKQEQHCTRTMVAMTSIRGDINRN
jgi:hypothetical protein